MIVKIAVTNHADGLSTLVLQEHTNCYIVTDALSGNLFIGGKKYLEGAKIIMPNIPQPRQYCPNPKKQWQGHVNKAQGAHFEKLIDQSCEYYRASGTAVIEKTPEPFHITRSLGGGKFQGNFAKFAQPDYKGVLNGGRMIVIEAKNSATERINQGRVTLEQAAALDAYEKVCALCFVMVSIQMRRFYMVPWQDWENMKQRYGRKYMTVENLKPYEKRFDGQKIKFL